MEGVSLREDRFVMIPQTAPPETRTSFPCLHPRLPEVFSMVYLRVFDEGGQA